VPPKADTGSTYSYAALRYLIDPQREVTVPFGVALWSADEGRLWFRLPHAEERIDGVTTAQARAYGAIVRAKIEGWRRLGELPYQTETLQPLSDAWWEAVRGLLLWRVRLGPLRIVTSPIPETELESLYQALVQPLPLEPADVTGEVAEEIPVPEALAADRL
jgi:hypothetical protein